MIPVFDGQNEVPCRPDAALDATGLPVRIGNRLLVLPRPDPMGALKSPGCAEALLHEPAQRNRLARLDCIWRP
jgi:hypothetical protein